MSELGSSGRLPLDFVAEEPEQDRKAECAIGEAAVAVHRGPYNRMNEAHEAIRKWIAANRRESAGNSWEIYGDPTPDPAETETSVVYLLK